MATFLFDQIIFGPVKSRRLGVSLGINLLPTDSKVCSFDCIYCECGWNPRKRAKKAVLPTRLEVKQLLEQKLKEMTAQQELPDVITFAGNGEPTLHPEFESIIDDTIALRNLWAPKARIAVLSNATMLHKPSVVRALLKIEDNIQKLDSGFEQTIRLIDCPASNFNLKDVVENLMALNGKVIIQTLFLKGNFKDQLIDNTTEAEVAEWFKLIQQINPSKVMIYTIDRDTPATGLEKVTLEELEKIAQRVRSAGFEVSVSG
ncbi:MAG: radical SAM protein [Methylococcaceae bacterium]|nr:radical SAM protein [Prolixibacteraceae bacterium]